MPGPSRPPRPPAARPGHELPTTYIGTGIVFSAELDEVILALSIADGTEVFRYQETAGINAQATVSGDNIYFPAGGPLIASSNTVDPAPEPVSQVIALKLSGTPQAAPEATPAS